MIIEVLLYILVLLTAWPVGIFLAWLCDDEATIDKKYLNLAIVFFIIALLIGLIVHFSLSMLLSLIYIIIVLFRMSLKK